MLVGLITSVPLRAGSPPIEESALEVVPVVRTVADGRGGGIPLR
jgi:hypothetical protein